MRLRRWWCAIFFMGVAPIFLALGAARFAEAQTATIATAANTDSVAAAPASDDLNACALNTGRWTLTNLASDGSIRMTGQGLQITVPATGDHNLWVDNKNALRVMQPVDNQDFAIEVKFESSVEQRFQTQGVIVQQDENNFLRFDYYHDGTAVRAFAVSFTNNSPTVRKNAVITASVGVDMFIMLARTGNTWTAQHRSLDGNAWKVTTSFEHPLTVVAVGVFAGNVAPRGGQPPPAFTATVDYFFNSAARIDPEDPNPHALEIRTTGDGSGAVSKNPAKDSYACDEQIQLTANANAGSLFSNWSGAVTGATSPAIMTIAQGEVVTATFIVGQMTPGAYMPLVQR